MADNSIFSNDNTFGKKEEKTRKTRETFAGKNLQKFGNSLEDLGEDVVTSIADEAEGTFNSFKDRFLPKGLRQNEDDSNFIIDEISIANRHTDAINGILTDTFSGNLFDAGVSALNLLNFGTKIKLVYDQYTDKDSYPFRYKYYSANDDDITRIVKDLNTKGSEVDEDEVLGGILSLLDSIEDPTVLGYSLKINYTDAPLFKGVGDTPEKVESATSTLKEKGSEADDESNNAVASTPAVIPSNSALDFITRYSLQHRELVMCQEYLEEFTEGIKQIFESPETVSDSGRRFNDNTGYRNHYIQEIKGLDKLDNPFVEYKDKVIEQEAIELVLGEDVRMFTNRLAFLYRNLTWSYNMGKKLIPENKLRFDLYIKMSDMRSFTSIANKKIGRDNYSRIIYELKDCEFLFNESLNPDGLKMSGFSGVNDEYANLKLKIKYRKVNRIFYSRMFGNDSGGIGDMYIGDKFYEAQTSNKSYTANYRDELKAWGFAPENTKKRADKSNNIAVAVSLDERLNKLKTQGLFKQDDDDTGLNRFIKGIGNEAVKSGASLVDEGLQKVKSNLNNQQSGVDNLFGNNFSGSVRDFLDGNIGKKTTKLGDLHPSGNGTIKEPSRDLHPDANNNIISPSDDVHPTINNDITTPNVDLHPDSGFSYTKPNEDLHPELDITNIAPEEDLHPELDIEKIAPEEDLHPDTENPIILPNVDLHPDVDNPIVSPSVDLHPDADNTTIAPDGDVHNDVENSIIAPNVDLHPDTNNTTITPDGEIHGDVDATITIENKNVNSNDKGDSSILPPDGNVHKSKKNSITNPNEVRDDNFLKFVRKDPPANGAVDDS